MSQSGEHTAKVPDAAGHIAYSAEEDAVWLECGNVRGSVAADIDPPFASKAHSCKQTRQTWVWERTSLAPFRFMQKCFERNPLMQSAATLPPTKN